MEKMEYHKLVRDRIPEIMAAAGKAFETRVLEDDFDFEAALRKKVVEEAAEVQGAPSREELVKELADLEEVVLALKERTGITDAEIEQVRRERLEKRGGFAKRIMLDWAERPDRP